MRLEFKKIKYDDIKWIVDIYNSNVLFLMSHIGQKRVDFDWVENEIEQSHKMGFESFKVLDLDSKSIVGFIDFKSSKDTYLSLLMLDKKVSGRGVGKEVYQTFERTICMSSSSIRIDAVSEYSDSVLKFWETLGFNHCGRTKLEWGNKVLDAVVMRKDLKVCNADE